MLYLGSVLKIIGGSLTQWRILLLKMVSASLHEFVKLTDFDLSFRIKKLNFDQERRGPPLLAPAKSTTVIFSSQLLPTRKTLNDHTLLLNAATFWLQAAVINSDVCPSTSKILNPNLK